MMAKQPRPPVRVTVRCVECGHTWTVGAGEVAPGYMPTCPKCMSFGVATGAKR